MKKLLALMLALLLCVSMAACGESAEVKETNAAAAGETTTVPQTQTETTDPVIADPQKTEPEETIPEETEPEETEPEVTESIETEPEQKGATPLLYKVTDEDGDVVWLFGSIHVGWDAYYPLPDYVLDAFDGSDALAVEYDIVAFSQDYGAILESQAALLYTDGTTIADHIPADIYDRAVAILEENNSYNSLLDFYCPMAWSSSIDQFLIPKAGADAELGIDKYMINLAYDCDKPVLDVESPELQYGMLAGFSDEVQALVLESSVEGYENAEEYCAELTVMMEAWMAGDEAVFAQIADTSFETEDPADQALLEEYQYTMETERNIGMTDFAVEALEDGEEIFICVGAAHVVGEGGMVEMLRELGYTVELVR